MDLMHMGDCKGLCALAFGSMLSMLMENPRLGRVKADRLMALEDFRKTWYSPHAGTHQLKKLRVSNFTDSDGWANLTSPTVKTANARAATPMMRDMAVLWFGRGTPIDNAVLRLMSCLAEYYDVLYGEDLFMRDSSVTRIRDICNRLGSDWMGLRNWSALKGKLWWKISPKVHRMQHTAIYCLAINPRFIQGYSEEAFMGTTSKVWRKSMSGPYQSHVQEVVLLKRAFGVCIRFEM